MRQSRTCRASVHPHARQDRSSSARVERGRRTRCYCHRSLCIHWEPESARSGAAKGSSGKDRTNHLRAWKQKPSMTRENTDTRGTSERKKHERAPGKAPPPRREQRGGDLHQSPVRLTSEFESGVSGSRGRLSPLMVPEKFFGRRPTLGRLHRPSSSPVAQSLSTPDPPRVSATFPFRSLSMASALPGCVPHCLRRRGTQP